MALIALVKFKLPAVNWNWRVGLRKAIMPFVLRPSGLKVCCRTPGIRNSLPHGLWHTHGVLSSVPRCGFGLGAGGSDPELCEGIDGTPKLSLNNLARIMLIGQS